MLVLRSEQYQVLALAAEARFAAEARAMLAEHWPRLAEALGAAGLRDHVDRGIADARGHAFTAAVHVLQYLNITCALGLDFATRHRWAARILAEPLGPADRIARLVAATSRHLSS
jgi:hypothetical protein